MVKTVVVIFVEGETEIEFYRKLVQHIREKRGGRLHCKVKYKNLKGIGNYKKNIANYLDQEIRVKYPYATIKAALCYDSDVFQNGKKPPVNWKTVHKDLKLAGVDAIVHVKAAESIEDWFLLDTDGLRKYLILPKTIKINQKGGLKELQRLFRQTGKIYVKGEKCRGLINALDYDVIISSLAEEMQRLESIVEG